MNFRFANLKPVNKLPLIRNKLWSNDDIALWSSVRIPIGFDFNIQSGPDLPEVVKKNEFKKHKEMTKH